MMKNNKLTVAEVADNYGVTHNAVRYIMQSRKTDIDGADEYYRKKATATYGLNDDAEENSELKTNKLEAQISKLKIESSEKYLKIQKAIKNLIDKKEVESFVIRVAAAVKSAKSLVFSDLSTKLEGLESGEIDLILQDASNQIDKAISKEFEKMIESLDND